MKKILFLFFVLGFLSNTPQVHAGSISERYVTAEAKACLHKLHPKASNVEWEDKVKKGYYKVKFYDGNNKVKMEISTSGEVLKSEESSYYNSRYSDSPSSGDSSAPASPKFVKEYIDKHYPSSTILFTKRERRGNRSVYVSKITYNNNYGNRRHRTLVFSEDGGVIKG